LAGSKHRRTGTNVVAVAESRFTKSVQNKRTQQGGFYMAKAEKKTDKKPLTKSQIVEEIAEATGLAKKDVAAVIDTLGEEIKKSIGKKGSGSFIFPGLLKIEKKHVKAKPAQKNVPNPLKPGTFTDRPAKPAHYRVKIKPLKALKDVV
jgi:nucleoid DNA-binding protein